jgi:NAD(P)-dependent dehydrogenase (short-subunit alcohol dehydrogenase family)
MNYVFPAFDLSGEVALVTGAARGLGRAISLALAHAGADVALGLRDVKTGGELAKEIGAMGRRALPVQMDMTRPDQISRAIDDTVANFGRLDILVNNAGLAPENLAENVREDDFDLTLAVNLKGTFFASQAAGRVMNWTESRMHHKYEFAGGLCGTAYGINLLHDEGCYRAPDQMSGRRVG